MNNVTLGKTVVPRPVRVRSHAGEFRGEGPDGEEIVVPGFEGIVMDRNAANKFIGIPSARTDRAGYPTPKALTLECEICGTPYPPKTHLCFQGTIDTAGLLDEPVPCEFCGEPISEKDGMDKHFQTSPKHKGVRPKVAEGTKRHIATTGDDEVNDLKNQVRILTELVTRLTPQPSPSVKKKEVIVPTDLNKLASELLDHE